MFGLLVCVGRGDAQERDESEVQDSTDLFRVHVVLHEKSTL